MRLSDVDALLAEILHDIETSGCVNHERDMLDSIRYAPTIDAVPVVRCYECQHSDTIAAGYSKHIDTGEMMACRIFRGTEDATTHFSIVPFDGYCDEGERKEGPT